MNVENSIPVAFECPFDTYHDSTCKHRVAVAIREPMYERAEAVEVMTDGRTTVDRSAGGEHGREASERPEDCECLLRFEDLSYWPCYREGFRTPNSAGNGGA